MNIEITKSDLEPLMWLQTAVEKVLLEEVLRRAKELGDIAQDQQWLPQSDVGWDQWANEVAVSYTKPRRPGVYHESDTTVITFTLAEALRLALKE